MQAIIKTGGKQYKVSVGSTIKVESLKVEVGQVINFDQVLMLVDGDNIQIGAPIVNGACVTAEVVSHGKHDKVRIFKLRRRKHYQRSQGHRQCYTEVKIHSIGS
jgi:large subunit ribosomal protein L21